MIINYYYLFRYIGEIANLKFKKITPKKSNMLDYSPSENEKISKLRVHVERFFGRMKKIFKLSSTRYRFDHSHFDIDINNIILLTNEHIRYVELLNYDDAIYYWKWLNNLAEKANEKNKKRKESQDKYLEKRRRLNDQFALG